MFWNILKNDIVRGMFKRKYLYIIATTVIAVLVIATDLSMRRKIGTQGYCGSVSAGDLLQVFYRGSRIIRLDNIMEYYMSEQYLFMVLGISFIVGSYCIKDLSSVGMQIILRCGSIGKWFASKIVWCFVSAFYITVLTDILIEIISVIHRYDLGFNIHMEVLHMYGYSNNTASIDAGEIAVISIVLPLMSLFTIALIQMLLSMLCSPIISLLLISAGMVITIFSGNAFLIFNGLMCMRNNVYISGGTDSVHMMLADAVIILLCAILGYVYIRRIDILNTKEV